MSQQINLLNPLFRKKRSFITSPVGIASATGVAIALMLVFGVYEMLQVNKVEAQARAVGVALADARAKSAAEPTGVRKPDPALEAVVTALAADLKSRHDAIEALKGGNTGAIAGFSDYVRTFSRQRVEGVWLTGFDLAAGGTDLTITGRTLSADLVPTYLQRLKEEAPMQGRQFSSVAINRGGSKPGDGKEPEPRAALPPFLEFTIASGGAREGKVAAGESSQPSIALRAPLEAEMQGKKAGPQ